MHGSNLPLSPSHVNARRWSRVGGHTGGTLSPVAPSLVPRPIAARGCGGKKCAVTPHREKQLSSTRPTKSAEKGGAAADVGVPHGEDDRGGVMRRRTLVLLVLAAAWLALLLRLHAISSKRKSTPRLVDGDEGGGREGEEDAEPAAGPGGDFAAVRTQILGHSGGQPSDAETKMRRDHVKRVRKCNRSLLDGYVEGGV